VKALRQRLIKRLQDLPACDPARQQGDEDLEDVFLVVQLFSYPGDYVAQRPTIERIAETLDKFEEDVLRVKTATIRGSRRATVTFAAPIRVAADRGKDAAAGLTRLLEERVQAMLEEDQSPASRTETRAAAG
jgi:hypothetical protein